jgi:GTP cyclohydrolase II
LQLEPDRFEAFTQLTLIASSNLPTTYGTFELLGFQTATVREVIALRYRDDSGAPPPDRPLVRIHSQCFTGDVFGSQRCDCGPQLANALEAIARARCGLVIYEFDEGRGIGLLNKIRAYSLQDDGFDTVDANEAIGMPVDAREYDLAVEVLRFLGLDRVALLTNNPAKVAALSKAGVDVARVPLLVPVASAAWKYMNTKRERMGHIY